MFFRQRFVPGLAIYSYMVGDERSKECAVIDATRVVFDLQRQAGIDLPTDGELYRFDVNHPDTNGMIEYFIRPMANVSSVVGRSITEEFAREGATLALHVTPLQAGRQLAALGKQIAMHIAAANPQYVSKEEVPSDILEREKEIYRGQVTNKPAQVVDKIVEGKLEKFFSDACLLEQVFIKDPVGKLKIRDLITEKIAKMGENIVIRRFVRFQLGEGIDKNAACES